MRWIRRASMAAATVAVLAAGATLWAAQDKDTATTQPRERDVLRGPRMKGEGGPGSFRGDRQQMRHRALMGVLRELDLTDEQREKIRALAADGRQAMEAWRQEHETELTELREQIADAREARDREKLKGLHEKMKVLHASLPEKARLLERIKEVLTDEQRQKLEQRLEELREQRPGPGMGPGDGEGRKPRAEGERRKERKGDKKAD